MSDEKEHPEQPEQPTEPAAESSSEPAAEASEPAAEAQADTTAPVPDAAESPVEPSTNATAQPVPEAVPFPDDPFQQSDKARALRGAPKCLGLFIIMAIIYFFNLYCAIHVIPKVEQNFDDNQVELTETQQTFLTVSHKLNQERFWGYLPVLLIMAMGILTLMTRQWGAFSAVFFVLILLQFAMFLYGWMSFALPLIQLKHGGAPAG